MKIIINKINQLITLMALLIVSNIVQASQAYPTLQNHQQTSSSSQMTHIDPRTRVSSVDTTQNIAIDVNGIFRWGRDWFLNPKRGKVAFIFNPNEFEEDLTDGLRTHDGFRRIIDNENGIQDKIKQAIETGEKRKILKAFGEAMPEYADRQGIFNTDSLILDAEDFIKEVGSSTMHRYDNPNNMNLIANGHNANRLKGFDYGDNHQNTFNPFNQPPRIQELNSAGQPIVEEPDDNSNSNNQTSSNASNPFAQPIKSSEAMRNLDYEDGFDTNTNNILAAPLGLMAGIAAYAYNLNFFTALATAKITTDTINDITRIASEITDNPKARSNNAQDWYAALDTKYAQHNLGLNKKHFVSDALKSQWENGYKQIYCPKNTYKQIHLAMRSNKNETSQEYLASQEWEVLRNTGKVKYYDSIVTPLVYTGINVGLVAGLRKMFNTKIAKNKLVWVAIFCAATTIQTIGGKTLCGAYSRFKEGMFDGYANKIATNDVLQARKNAFDNQSRSKNVSTYPTAAQRAAWIETRLQARQKDAAA